jgi:hypothetical protein
MVILLTGLVLNAQNDTQPTKSEPLGKLSGVIRDSGNARVAKAKITVEREGFRREVIAADDGSYVIELPVNIFTVTITSDAFYPTCVVGVQIGADAVTDLPVVLRTIEALENLVFPEEVSTETVVPNNTIELKKPKRKH